MSLPLFSQDHCLRLSCQGMHKACMYFSETAKWEEIKANTHRDDGLNLVIFSWAFHHLDWSHARHGRTKWGSTVYRSLGSCQGAESPGGSCQQSHQASGQGAEVVRSRRTKNANCTRDMLIIQSSLRRGEIPQPPPFLPGVNRGGKWAIN